MRIFVIVIYLILICVLLWCFVTPPAEPQILHEQIGLEEVLIDFGEIVFDDVKNGCGMCHKIEQEDNRRAPLLKGLSERMTFKQLGSWLSKHLYEPPRKFMFPGNNGPSELVLTSLTSYLSTI